MEGRFGLDEVHLLHTHHREVDGTAHIDVEAGTVVRTELEVQVQPRPSEEAVRDTGLLADPGRGTVQRILVTVIQAAGIFVGPVGLLVGGIVTGHAPFVVDELAGSIPFDEVLAAGPLVGGLVEEVRGQPRLLAPVIVGQTLVPVACQTAAHAPAVHDVVGFRTEGVGRIPVGGDGGGIVFGHRVGQHPGILGVAVVEPVHRIRPLLLGERGAAGCLNGLLGIAVALLPEVGLVGVFGSQGLGAGRQVQVGTGIDAIDDAQVGLDLVRAGEAGEEFLGLRQVGKDQVVVFIYGHPRVVRSLCTGGLFRYDRNAQVPELSVLGEGELGGDDRIGRILPFHDLDDLQIEERTERIALAHVPLLDVRQLRILGIQADDVIDGTDIGIIQINRPAGTVGVGEVAVGVLQHGIETVVARIQERTGSMVQHLLHGSV